MDCTIDGHISQCSARRPALRLHFRVTNATSGSRSWVNSREGHARTQAVVAQRLEKHLIHETPLHVSPGSIEVMMGCDVA
jgi:hypothetical protein